MKQLPIVVCAIATLFMIGCAGPTQPQQPAATEEEAITTMDFESGEAETPTETSVETEVDSDGVDE